MKCCKKLVTSIESGFPRWAVLEYTPSIIFRSSGRRRRRRRRSTAVARIFVLGGGHPVDAVETTTPVVSTFSTSIRLLSSFFIKHCILPPPFSLSFCPSICLSSLSVVPHPVFLISGLSCGLKMLMFSSCNPKFFAVNHSHSHSHTVYLPIIIGILFTR